MNTIFTPEPHFIPGYTGHCPRLRFRPGKTYGQNTHKLLLDPCCPHAPELIVSIPDDFPACKDRPTRRQLRIIKGREPFVDPLYRHPIIPGYDGHVPNLSKTLGLRYMAAATEAIAEHEQLMDLYRCEWRNLMHRGLMEGGEGCFKAKLGERLMPLPAKYRGPLYPVQPRAQAIRLDTCNYREEKQPYSKHSVPHFMCSTDEEKYIVNGYDGHIPKYIFRYGETHQTATHNALNRFTHTICKNRRDKWCPRDGISEKKTSACPNTGHFLVYHPETSIIPNYGGHVPGANYLCGATFGRASKRARKWLDIHRPKNYVQECHNIPAP